MAVAVAVVAVLVHTEEEVSLAHDMRLKCTYRGPVAPKYAWCLSDPKAVYECCFIAGHQGVHGCPEGPLAVPTDDIVELPPV